MSTTGRATARRPPKTAGSACSPGSRKTASRNFLIRVHPGLLDERAPLVDLRLEVLAQRFGRGLAHRHGLGAEIGEALLHRSEEHTSELQSRLHLVCRLLLEKKKKKTYQKFGGNRHAASL